MPKYEYAFDRINLEDFPVIGLDTEPFQKVLQARGKEGWIYSGYLPVNLYPRRLVVRYCCRFVYYGGHYRLFRRLFGPFPQ